MCADVVDVVCVEYGNGDFAFEDAVVGCQRDALDDELTEVFQHVGNGIKYTLAVNTFDIDVGVEVHGFVRVPFHGDDVVAVTGLEQSGFLAVALVNFEPSLRCDVPYDVVAGYGVAAGGHLALFQHFFVEDERLFAVEILERAYVFADFLLFALFPDEGDESAPVVSVSFS